MNDINITSIVLNFGCILYMSSFIMNLKYIKILIMISFIMLHNSY